MVEFSSLRHLKAMQRRQVRRLKIRQWLLLVLRMLIILMVVLAFARPTATEGEIGSHASVSAVVLLDNSASMSRYVSDGSLFEIARRRTRELLETFSQSDQVCLLPLVNLPTGTATFASAAVALDRLEQVQVGWKEGDLQTVLESSGDLLSRADNLVREMYIVTDRQRHSLPDQELFGGIDARVYLVDLPLEEAENRGIVSVDLGGQLILPGHDFDLTATIKNYGPERGTELIASCFLDDRRVAQKEFEIAGGAETTVRFTQMVSQTGFHSGYVEISDDRFLADNRYCFSFRIPDKFGVLIINGDEAADYMKLALVPNPDIQQYWSVKEATPQQLTGVNLRDYDVFLLAGAPALNSSHVVRIKNHVKRGKALFVSFGGATDIENFNRTWSDVTGILYDEPVKQTFTRAGYYTLQSVDLNHPVFSVFDFEADRPPQIKFFTLPRMHVTGDARTLIRFTGDRPALVESSYGSGKVLTFTGPMAPYYTDLVSHGFFVPMISRIAEYLASDLSSLEVCLFTDENITRSLSLTGTVTDPVELITPDSTSFYIPPEEEHGTLVVRVQPADRAGIYHLRYHGREIDRFAVNINPVECDLTSVDPDQFAAALGASDYRWLGTDATLSDEISAYRIGRELWQIFLWLAILFLVVEMILGRGSPDME